MIAASILVCVFINVTWACCEEMAKKLFEHFLQLFWHLRPHDCLANSRVFKDQTHFPGFYKHNSRTFQEAW